MACELSDAACEIFSWDMWDLVLRPGIEPRPLALGGVEC